MTDVLFPEAWPEINIDDYVAQHKLTFDQIDLRTIPNYTLIEKIRMGGLLQGLLENDPLKHDSKKRDRLNSAVLKEIRRQLGLLVAEYNRRVEALTMTIDSQPKTFLSKNIPVMVKPDSVVVGVKSLKLSASRG